MKARDADVVHAGTSFPSVPPFAPLLRRREGRRPGRRDHDGAVTGRHVVLREGDHSGIGVVRGAGTCARTAPNAASVVRVTSSVEPRPTISAAMAAT